MTAPLTLVHLVCGATGAGKSTYARQLAQDLGGVRFSIDEWMQMLHNADKPETNLFEWFFERVQRNCRQMRATADQLARLGIPAIFDCGLTNQAERRIFTDWAEEMGYCSQLHFIDVPAKTRWRRVERRNLELGETFHFHVSRDMFDFIESIWEPPNGVEMARLNGLRISGP
ncbi:MAG: AAA family ATPase [Halocynthiibacter sp.]